MLAPAWWFMLAPFWQGAGLLSLVLFAQVLCKLRGCVLHPFFDAAMVQLFWAIMERLTGGAGAAYRKVSGDSPASPGPVKPPTHILRLSGLTHGFWRRNPFSNPLRAEAAFGLKFH